MRRIVFLAAALSLVSLPRDAAAQYDLGGFIMAGQGGGGTSLFAGSAVSSFGTSFERGRLRAGCAAAAG